MRTLPAGFVSFVFTDIEGSTQLHRELGADYRAVAEDHDRLLRAVISEHGGVVVKTMGDGVFAAFAEPAAALSAGVAIQDAVGAHDWPSEARVRVRIGMHAGQATPADDDYIALAVHQAARVASAAHGGQVVATAAVVDAASAPSADVAVTSLGEHRIRDFDGPTTVYQVHRPGPLPQFPRIRSIDPERRNLPTPATPLVGRSSALDDLHRRILRDGQRLVTLVGPGGVGKTRLATEAAHLLADHFPDGAWFVALDATPAGGDVAAALAAAVRAPEHRDGPLAALRTALAVGRQLLVTDNWEHLVDAADVLADLLDACPALVVLATSQRRLRLRAEHVVHVVPLDVPATDATPAEVAGTTAPALFASRAAAITPFSITAETAPYVARICAAVGGLPLALELCAGRIDEFAVAELADAIERQLEVLDHGARDAPSRHRSLRAALQWSTSLLPPDDARVFRRLGIFAAGFRTDDVVAVCGDAGREVLQQLVERNLVAGEPDTDVYRMLAAVHEYAVEELRGAGEYDDAAAALLDHLLNRAAGEPNDDFGLRRDPVGRSLPVVLDWAITDGHDPAAGARLASQVWHVWDGGGLSTDARAWTERALAATDDPAVRGRLLASLAWSRYRLGLPDAAEPAQAAVAAAGTLPYDRGAALQALMALALAEGDTSGALEFGERAADEWRSIRPDHPLLETMLLPLAMAAEGSDPARATALAEAAIASEVARRDPDVHIRSLLVLVRSALFAGDLAEAGRLVDEGEGLARRHDLPLSLALMLRARAQLALAGDDETAARAAIDDSVRVGGEAAPHLVALRAQMLVELAARAGDHALAEAAVDDLVRPSGVVLAAAPHAVAVATVAGLRAEWYAAAVAARTALAVIDRRERRSPLWLVSRATAVDRTAAAQLTAADAERATAAANALSARANLELTRSLSDLLVGASARGSVPVDARLR